ncbi:hypothetical protein OLMES_2451 [Oleiphilus messinensis]|uniref:Uncharacterized protein n=1 Tax=Oleiphilus messinensis TaxID=141451 RepID=A0A1Y0I7N5_9GAMM|nr:hypothetical protein OLMES_2451 [Oleiphilus messinensis]
MSALGFSPFLFRVLRISANLTEQTKRKAYTFRNFSMCRGVLWKLLDDDATSLTTFLLIFSIMSNSSK